MSLPELNPLPLNRILEKVSTLQKEYKELPDGIGSRMLAVTANLLPAIIQVRAERDMAQRRVTQLERELAAASAEAQGGRTTAEGKISTLEHQLAGAAHDAKTAMEECKGRVNELTSDIAHVNEEKSGLEKQVGTLNEALSKVQDTLADETKQTVALATKLCEMKDAAKQRIEEVIHQEETRAEAALAASEAKAQASQAQAEATLQKLADKVTGLTAEVMELQGKNSQLRGEMAQALCGRKEDEPTPAHLKVLLENGELLDTVESQKEVIAHLQARLKENEIEKTEALATSQRQLSTARDRSRELERTLRAVKAEHKQTLNVLQEEREVQAQDITRAMQKVEETYSLLKEEQRENCEYRDGRSPITELKKKLQDANELVRTANDKIIQEHESLCERVASAVADAEVRATAEEQKRLSNTLMTLGSPFARLVRMSYPEDTFSTPDELVQAVSAKVLLALSRAASAYGSPSGDPLSTNDL